MPESINGPFRIYKRRGSNATNDGSAQTNASGLALGDNTGATTVSQEFVFNQSVTGTSANIVLYKQGVSGAALSGGVVTPGTTGAIATIPAGSRIQSFANGSAWIFTTPTGTAPTLNFFLNGTQIATSASIGGNGAVAITLANTAAAYALITDVPTTDAVLTVTLTGTGLGGTIAGEFSLSYTVRNADGSIIPYGQGLTNDGTNAPVF